MAKMQCHLIRRVPNEFIYIMELSGPLKSNAVLGICFLTRIYSCIVGSLLILIVIVSVIVIGVVLVTRGAKIRRGKCASFMTSVWLKRRNGAMAVVQNSTGVVQLQLQLTPRSSAKATRKTPRKPIQKLPPKAAVIAKFCLQNKTNKQNCNEKHNKLSVKI